MSSPLSVTTFEAFRRTLAEPVSAVGGMFSVKVNSSDQPPYSLAMVSMSNLAERTRTVVGIPIIPDIGVNSKLPAMSGLTDPSVIPSPFVSYSTKTGSPLVATEPAKVPFVVILSVAEVPVSLTKCRLLIPGIESTSRGSRTSIPPPAKRAALSRGNRPL